MERQAHRWHFSSEMRLRCVTKYRRVLLALDAGMGADATIWRTRQGANPHMLG